MKRHIPLVLLLAVVLCLSGCAGRYGLPTEPPTSATKDTPQAAESEKSTKMTTEETTMHEIATTEPMLLLNIDGQRECPKDALHRRFSHKEYYRKLNLLTISQSFNEYP